MLAQKLTATLSSIAAGQFVWAGLFCMNHRILSFSCALLVFGCADDDRIRTAASVPEAPGVSGGTLTDTLTVYAVDAQSGEAVQGAMVWLGAGADAHEAGRTGADGRLELQGMAGESQTVSVRASGFAAATWGAIASAVVTVPLEAISTVQTNTTISVTLPEWPDLPALPSGSYRIARFAYARPNALPALEAAPGEARAECRQVGALSGPCSVQLSVPSDSSALLVVIAEGTDSGTPDYASDDVVSTTRIGLATQLSLRAPQLAALELPLLDPDLTARASVVPVGSSHASFDDVVGVPGISLAGQVLLYPRLFGRTSSFLVPIASAAPDGTKLWAVATASNGLSNDWSRIYERGIELPQSSDAPVVLPTDSFLDLPRITQPGAGTFQLSSVGTIQRLEFRTSQGERLQALLFPAQSEFTIPTGVLRGELSSASLEAFDADLDMSDFQFQDLVSRSKRIAYVETRFR